VENSSLTMVVLVHRVKTEGRQGYRMRLPAKV
jgi:hypothetical protein